MTDPSRAHDHAVVIAGAGPTGLMLAAELKLAGVDALIVERRPNQEIAGSRAGGLHARSIEVLDQRGVADRFISAGQITHNAGFALIQLDMSDFPTRHNYVLGLWQNHIERILAEWVHELGVRIHYGVEVTEVSQDDDGVEVEIVETDRASSSPASRRIRARYLVGCDGGRSVVRKTAGIDFPGWDPTTSHMIAEVEVTDAPELGIRRDAAGIHGFSRVKYEIKDGKIVYANEGPVRVMITDAEPITSDPTFDELRATLVSKYGTDYGIHSPIFVSRFSDMTRQAASYRSRRVLLAGDAAHIHSPAGGQGLNTGLQDAVNLGWKLARVVTGTSPESLLDTYHSERHPVGARVLRNTMAQVALMRSDDRTQALHGMTAELLALSEPRKRIAGMISGLDIHYDLGEGHPLLGRRMPDVDLVTADGPVRLYTLLHETKPVLLDLGGSGELDAVPWLHRVRHVEARYDGPWELPVIGTVSAPTTLLIRPDGHVAWVGESSYEGLEETLTKWFGPSI
jgi:2-polyprenyl-6-methoxyphenol hydroxylase-like FAD-dependent oxidoreductase